ncbi:MAG: response regulator [Candidatus Protistobacter heckmanni]|nr:response regulator [Candidatus Protistobacter heckmanni]
MLLDMRMPHLGGIEVLKELRREPRTRYVPVVILTSSQEEIDIKTCLDEGANSYICKPQSFEAFSRELQTIQDYWLRLNRSVAAK